MLSEREYSYNIFTDASMFNEYKAFKLSSYQDIIEQASEQHLDNIGSGIPALVSQYNISWVLLSLSAEILSPITDGMRLQARTWCSACRPPLFRRELIFEDRETGSCIMKAATFSTLLDLSTRKVVSDRSVYGRFQGASGPTMIEAFAKYRKSDDALIQVNAIEPSPSWIDCLGHVNNKRYGEMVYNSMDDDMRRHLSELKRLDIWFTHELTLSESVTIFKNMHSLIWRGIRSDGEHAFTLKIQ